MLTREQILNKDDRKVKIIPIPEWDGEVTIRSLSAKDRADYIDAIMLDGGKIVYKNITPVLLILGCKDPKFERADLELLMQKDGAILDRLAEEILALSGIDLYGNPKNG